MRYLSAAAFVLVAASAAAQAQTAGSAVSLYQYGVAVGTPANPLTVQGGASGTAIPVTLGAGTSNAGSVSISPPTLSTTHASVTTSATAGTSSQLIASGSIVRGFQIENTCGTAVWWSQSLSAGTALTALNSDTLAPGATWISPVWWAPTASPLIVASATAVACTAVADWR